MTEYYGIVDNEKTYITTVEHLHEILCLGSYIRKIKMILSPTFTDSSSNHTELKTDDIIFDVEYELCNVETFRMFQLNNQTVLKSIVDFTVSKSYYDLLVDIFRECLILYGSINLSSNDIDKLLIDALYKKEWIFTDFIVDNINISNDSLNKVVLRASINNRIDYLDKLCNKCLDKSLKITVNGSTLSICLHMAAVKNNKQLLQWWCDKHTKQFVKIPQFEAEHTCETLRNKTKTSVDYFETFTWFYKFYIDNLRTRTSRG